MMVIGTNALSGVTISLILAIRTRPAVVGWDRYPSGRMGAIGSSGASTWYYVADGFRRLVI